MPIGLIFWILMILWLLSKIAVWRGVSGPYGPYLIGSSDWLLWILFFFVGWRIFGPMIQG